MSWGSNGWGDSTWGHGNTSVTVTGVEGAAAIAVDTAWGSDTWGEDTWGGSTNPAVDVLLVLSVPVTGEAGTGSVGSVTVNGKAVVSPTGEAGTGIVGNESILLVTNLPVTGVAGTTSVGSVSVSGNAPVTVTGFGMVMSSGEELVWGEIVTSQTPNWSEIKAA